MTPSAPLSLFVYVPLVVSRRLRSAVEGNLAELEVAYNRLEDTEREKRAAGILKVRPSHFAELLVRAGSCVFLMYWNNASYRVRRSCPSVSREQKNS